MLEEGGDHVKSSWPLWVGLQVCYNGDYSGWRWRQPERKLKSRRSSDCSLQLENMKSESLVIADQHAAVNMYLGCAHPAHHVRKVVCGRRGTTAVATAVGMADASNLCMVIRMKL